VDVDCYKVDMTAEESILARLDALEARLLALLEYQFHRLPPADLTWTPRDPVFPPDAPVYEHYIDPMMRSTRNGV
jgi:hypothetical protein